MCRVHDLTRRNPLSSLSVDISRSAHTKGTWSAEGITTYICNFLLVMADQV